MQRAAILIVLLTLSGPVGADAYVEAYEALNAAYEEGDYEAMRRHALEALEARPGYPYGLFYLAAAEALADEPAAALATLAQIQAQQVSIGAVEKPVFAGLHDLPGWADYVRREKRLLEPTGDALVAASYDEPHFIPEGIAVDATGSLWIGSIRTGDIVRLGTPPAVVVSGAGGPHWSVFAMRMHEGRLYFVSAAVPEYGGEHPSGPSTGLFAADPLTGQVVSSVLLPGNGRGQVLGDFLFIDDETLLLSDQADGIIYRHTLGSETLEVFVDKGTLRSPQGLAHGPDRQSVYVADYRGGLFRIDLKNAAVQQVRAPATLSLYGIDGLERYGPDLIAIQNGIQPHRVVRLRLDGRGLLVESHQILAMNLAEFDEPTLGRVAGDVFYFVANSHWNRFDANHELPEGLQGPVVLGIDLDAAGRGGSR